ncbi:unnamed protein product [Rotaria sp. Silwood2]|nr:unnamed protein product [Rotaria sp. Silwood2]
MINPSFSNDHNDAPISARIPVVIHSQQVNESSKRTQPITSNLVFDQNNQTNSSGKGDQIFVEHYSDGSTNQLEQILSYYRQDLKQRMNTQFDCDRKLITRLVDLIRPVYSLNQKNMKDLDILFNEILDLHDKRFIEQKEKNEQVQKENSHLKNLIVTSANEDNTQRKISQINSMVDYEELMEIEEDIRRLCSVVERQQNQINELIKLIPYQGKYQNI